MRTRAHAVCKVCHTKIKYLGNTAHLRNHLSRFHTERLLSKLAAAKETADPAQPRTEATLATNTEKGKIIPQSMGAFIGKDLRHYSVVHNTGLRHLLKTLEPRYKLPSRSHFTEKVTPALYHETKAQELSKGAKLVKYIYSHRKAQPTEEMLKMYTSITYFICQLTYC